MANALHAPIGLYDYLDAEEISPTRHEYLGGAVHAMTGGSMRHNRIAGNIYARLLQELAGTPCQVFINDMKLHVQAADSIYYPDVFVHCGGGAAGDLKVVTDAALIVEVLSESTATIDRREKRAACQRLAGLRAYWMVSQDEQKVELLERDANGSWQVRSCAAGEALSTAGLTSEPLRLAEIYAGTDLA